MHFALDSEQKALMETIESYIANRFDLAAVRRVVEDPDGDGIPASLWAAIREQGWLGVVVPERFGGLGLGMVEAQLIARAIGTGLLPCPWRSTVLSGEALRLAGSDQLQDEWLPAIATGEARAAIALEGFVRSEPGQPPPITGATGGVEYAAGADLLLLLDGCCLHLVDPDNPDVSVTPVEQYDGTTRLARVTLDRSSPRTIRCGRQTVEELRDRATVLVASELAGISREALRRTVAYAADRSQFGRSIGSFQAIKHALADLHVAVTMSEHAALYAAHAIDTKSPEASLAASVAKAKASNTARQSTAAMIQYHGGIGFTWEHDAHLFYKRAKRLIATCGDAVHHRERIAQLTVDPLGAPTNGQRGEGAGRWELSTIA